MKTRYKISITLDDGVIYQVYVEGNPNEEDILLDYYYQKHWEQQPDISKYSVVETPELCSAIKKVVQNYYKDEVSFTLAMRAVDYVEIYN